MRKSLIPLMRLAGAGRMFALLSFAASAASAAELELNVTGSQTLSQALAALSPAAVAEGVTFAPGTVFGMSASEIAQLVVSKDGYVVARDWSGTVPVTAEELRAAGWVLRERDGVLKVVRESGVTIIFR